MERFTFFFLSKTLSQHKHGTNSLRSPFRHLSHTSNYYAYQACFTNLFCHSSWSSSHLERQASKNACVKKVVLLAREETRTTSKHSVQTLLLFFFLRFAVRFKSSLVHKKLRFVPTLYFTAPLLNSSQSKSFSLNTRHKLDVFPFRK